jgi:putative ABC transport system permease protein
MLKLGLLSLLNRRATLALTVASIGLSVALILGIERLRSEARDGFTDTVSGIDLIVAARGNHVQILMATVFGVGSTTNALDGATYAHLAGLPEVAWAVPLAHGDNHRGYPVVGTTTAYFERFRYAGDEPLTFAAGTSFADAEGAVVGAEVARKLGYAVGTEIVNAHGAGDVSFDVHDEAPFTISGVLETTGTPVDRMVYVSLDGFATIHAETKSVSREAGPLGRLAGRSSSIAPRREAGRHDAHEARQEEHHQEAEQSDHDDHAVDGVDDHEEHAGHAHAPGKLNAVYIGLESKIAVLSVQRFIAEYRDEPLSALLPAATLLELWSLTAVAENSLRLVALAVVIAGVLGMLTMISATLEARRREFAILRSVGAAPWHVFSLIVFEAAVIVLAGLVAGLLLFYVAIAASAPLLADEFGLRMGLDAPSLREWGILLAVGAFGTLASLFPAFRVYRRTLADGLTLRI